MLPLLLSVVKKTFFIESVANVARNDVIEFLDLAARLPVRPEVDIYPLAELKTRRIHGAKVLRI